MIYNHQNKDYEFKIQYLSNSSVRTSEKSYEEVIIIQKSPTIFKLFNKILGDFHSLLE